MHLVIVSIFHEHSLIIQISSHQVSSGKYWSTGRILADPVYQYAFESNHSVWQGLDLDRN